jgi:hypothetical protein
MGKPQKRPQTITPKTMTGPVALANLKPKIRAVLQQAGSPMMGTALKSELERQFRGIIGDAEFNATLNDLLKAGQVAHDMDTLTGDNTWEWTGR